MKLGMTNWMMMSYFHQELINSHFCACTVKIYVEKPRNLAKSQKFIYMKSVLFRKMVISDFRPEVEIPPLVCMCKNMRKCDSIDKISLNWGCGIE